MRRDREPQARVRQRPPGRQNRLGGGGARIRDQDGERRGAARPLGDAV